MPEEALPETQYWACSPETNALIGGVAELDVVIAEEPDRRAGTAKRDRPAVPGMPATYEQCIGVVLAISITGVAIGFLLFGGCVDDFRKLIQ